MNRKHLTAVPAAAALTLALTACTGGAYGPGPAPEPAASTPAPVEDVQAQDGAAEVAPEDLAEDSSPLLAFGEAATFEDGLEVVADVIDTVQVSEVASTDCAVGDPVAVVELTVVNGTDARINPWEDFMGSLNAEYVDSSGYAVAADGVFDAPGYGHDYDLSGGQNFATLRPGQTGSDVYGFCTVDMEEGSLYLSLDPTTYDEPGYKDLVEWTEDGQW